MKNAFLIIILGFMSGQCFSQTPDSLKLNDEIIGRQFYDVVPPLFIDCPGLETRKEKKECSDEALKNRITSFTKSVKIPKEIRDVCFQFMAVVRFTVNEDGTISEPEILKSAGGYFEQEIFDFINDLPPFEVPPRRMGKPAKMKFAIPIRFGTI